MNLSKGLVGEDNSRLLGALLITKLQLAAMSRVDMPEEQRNDFYLYVDEFQNFATESFGKVHYQNLFFIHYLPHIDRGIGLADNIPDQRSGNELADLILNGGSSLDLVFLGIAGEFLNPKSLDYRIFQLLHNFLPPVHIGKKTVDGKQS